MPHVPGLRSCYAKVGRLTYFGRMSTDPTPRRVGCRPSTNNLGDAQFYVLTVAAAFLGVRYADLRERTPAGGTDEEILAWAQAHGNAAQREECHVESFPLKLGWRDERQPSCPSASTAAPATPIETVIDHIEFDEGRDPVATRLGLGLSRIRMARRDPSWSSTE